ncbi:hypothetical protein B0H11DRAFT_1994086 [Mycena galericulata]|nr:hypothetical protein B0H11DRAFT_1994086 [Mycena galericulata]
MNHPYSGAASYIYANEYPPSPLDPHHRNGPYGKMQSFIPIQSMDSLPSAHPYSHKHAWSTDGTTPTQTQTQFSEEEFGPRPRRESLRRLLPRQPLLSHPYAQQPLDEWIDDDEDESVAQPETPVTPRFQPRRTVPARSDQAVRRAALVPYEPRPFEERERERERDKARRAAAWRRKIQRRVRRAIRRLKRFLCVSNLHVD